MAEMEPGAVSQRGETQVRSWFLLQAALLAATRPQVPTLSASHILLSRSSDLHLPGGLSHGRTPVGDSGVPLETSF